MPAHRDKVKIRCHKGLEVNWIKRTIMKVRDVVNLESALNDFGSLT